MATVDLLGPPVFVYPSKGSTATTKVWRSNPRTWTQLCGSSPWGLKSPYAVLTQKQYLEVLHGLEVQLWRHADPWGNLPREAQVQEMKHGWEALARSCEEDHPAGHAPVPFWRMRRQPIICVLQKDAGGSNPGSGEPPPHEG
jgi:hypothetical protein